MLVLVGDSLAVGMEPWLHRPAIVRAEVGRRLPEGMRELERLGRRLRGATVWVSLGTNDGPQAPIYRAMKRTLRLVGPRGRVVWADAYVRGRSWGHGPRIRRLDRRERRLSVVSWTGAVRSGRVRLADGVHPGPEGYRWRVRAYRRATPV